MRVDLFDFELPERLIAVRPAEPRDAARLLHVTPTALADHGVRDLPALLRRGDLLVFNDTRVIPAQLAGRRGEARIELTLHKREGPGRWRAFARPARRLKPGDEIRFAKGFSARVLWREGAEAELDFACDDAAFQAQLARHGSAPLPPYIRRQREGGQADAQDEETYQTLYAREDGAVAAPTAGLHFTPGLFEALDRAGIERLFLTLHVGAGTFLPVSVDDTEDHRMHRENGRLSEDAAGRLNAVRAAGRRIVAVGTTSLRLLESAADERGRFSAFEADTDLFITPGYRFRAVDALMTNFHLPRSTLFMLVCALMGRERMQAAYRHAVAADYRFYSYGDAMLLEPEA